MLDSVLLQNIIDGIRSVRQVLQEMRNEASDADEHDAHARILTTEYRGLLIEQFSCEESFYTLIDVVAGNRSSLRRKHEQQKCFKTTTQAQEII